MTAAADASDEVPARAERTRATVERILDRSVRPSLSSHAGGIALVEVDESRRSVTLQMRGPCGPCYFRRTCESGVVRPELHPVLAGYEVRIVGGPR
ncbi:NifU family protein [uncultured Jatrophihabitans sp.]|uniref:NifU family protein n=1 Tax=uncultured Jatrophihabitans sp. TaxID=1610747 RepID=UPI0035CAE2D4